MDPEVITQLVALMTEVSFIAGFAGGMTFGLCSDLVSWLLERRAARLAAKSLRGTP